MALIGKISIAMMTDTKRLAAGLKTASAMLAGFQAKVEKTGSLMRNVLVGAVAYKAAEGFKSMVEGASHLNEAMSKTSAVFGTDASSVVAASNEMASAFGTSNREFLSNASTLGNIFTSAKMSTKAAADMSIQFTKLAYDAKSFNDLRPEEAFEKLRSGLRGEAEPLSAIGVMMTAAEVKAKALAMGFKAQGGELSDLAKIQARGAIIMDKTRNMQGDLAKTAAGVANASTGLSGRIQNASDALGTYFLPVTQQALASLNRFANGVNALIGKSGPQIRTFVDGAAAAWDTFTSGIGGIVTSMSRIPQTWSGSASALAGGLSAIGGMVDSLGLAWRNLPALVEVAALQWQEKVTNIGAYIATIPANLGIVGNYIANNWRSMVIDAVRAVSTAFSNLTTNLSNLGSAIGTFLADPTRGFHVNWTPILDGFKATTAELPALIKPSLVSLQSEIDLKLGAIGKAEMARSQRLAASAAERAKLAADAMASPSAAKAASSSPSASQASAPKFATAIQAGSREAVNALLRSRYGAGTAAKGPAEATAKNTAKSNELLTRILAATSPRALPPAVFGNF